MKSRAMVRFAIIALIFSSLSILSSNAFAAPNCTSSDYTTSTHMGTGTYPQYGSGEQSGVLYTVISFTTSGTNCMLVLPSSVSKVDVLVVGGGAGGGPRGGGGGGAGGYFFSSGYSVSGPETITVGSGGANTTSGCPGDGGDSTFFNTKVDGGGGAGGSGCNGGPPLTSGQPYGSGGGALYSANVTVTLDSDSVSSSILGNLGGAGSGGSVPMGWGGGGGGGAKSRGLANIVTNSGGTGYAGVLTNSLISTNLNYNGTGGVGGSGSFNLISGSKICYAAGGGGGNSISSSNSAGGGGLCADGVDTVTAGGSGGHGGASNTTGTVKIIAGSGSTPGSGGGGGGFGNCTDANSCSTSGSTQPANYSDGSNGDSGSGASGAVIIRYITPINFGLNSTQTTTHNTPTTISDTGTVSGYTRSWQWYRSINSGSTYSAISGATSASYTFTPDLPNFNNNLFRLIIIDTSPTGEVSTITTSALTLSVSPNPGAISSFTLTGSATTAIYRTTITVTATTNTAGKVTFYSSGKVLPNCRNINTSGPNPITASCVWKPSLHGTNSISARLVPTDSNYTTQTSSAFRVLTVPRTNNR